MNNFIEYYSDHIKVREATKQGYAIAVGGIQLISNNQTVRQGVVIDMNDGFVNRKYEEFYNKNGYIPNMFNPYNCNEIDDYSPTMTTQCGSTTSSSTVLIKEDNMNELMQVGQLEGKHEQSNRIYSEDGICPTIMAGERKSCTGGYVSPKIMVNTNKIIREIIPQKVRVRKYEVDVIALKELLRESKKSSGLTNRDISNKLNQPKTLVDHWFRNDNCFSIPDEDIWFDLKKLLNIQTDEFDKSIMTFEIRDGVFDKANRVYNSNGIAPTLTCVGAENERYKVYEDTNEITRVGQVSNKGSQAGMVYDPEGLFPTVCACTHGYAIGNILDNKLINKGVDNMWNNNLEKLNFEMEEIRIFDIFAGIGALHQSLKELGVPVRVTNLSEIDIDATISYAGGHIDNFKDLEFEYPSVEEMRQWLIDRNIGYSFEKNKSSVPRMKVEKLKLAYKSNVLLNNLGDISKIDYDKIEDFDLMNMSFPCTDLSNAGQQRGMRNEDGTPTRSGLYVYSIKAVRAKKPKYVMIENVKALIQKKFIEDFYSVISELEECGYNCYYPTKEDKKGNKIPTCLNAKDFGIPQNRERIFVIAIRKDIDTKTFEFPVGRDYGIRLKDVLEDQADEKYYLSPEIQNKISNWKAYQRPFENVLGENSTSPTITARGAGEHHSGMVLVGEGLKEKTNLESDKIICEQRSDEGLRFFKDNICGTLRTIDACGDKRVIENGAIRGRYNENGKIEQQLELRNDGVTNTLTTVEKDNVIVKNVSFNNKSEIRIRKLTPLECWRLMGFRDEAFYKAQELGISDSQLYKQAGNSIVVNCLYYIFKNLFKEYIK